MLLENVVELDTKGRIFSLQASPADLPILAMSDFAAAFPSVIHGWISACLVIYGFPDGFRNLVDGIYFFCFAYLISGGATYTFDSDSVWCVTGLSSIWIFV